MEFKLLMQEFRDEAARMLAKVDGLIHDKEKANQRQDELKQEYSEMLLGDVPQADLSKKKRELDRVSQELADYDERIEAVRQLRLDKLRSRLPELNEAKLREYDRRSEVYKATIPEARRLKAELLLYYCQMRRKINDIRAVHNQFMEAVNACNLDELPFLTYKRQTPHIPVFSLLSTYSGGMDAPFAPLEEEIINAFEYAKVQPWIRLYGETGELLSDSIKANKRLQELKNNE
ncbi:hypothetical protein GJ688_13855 [Heliobacillus mobilis]|uniref:Uncharacterized protein n=1 Tax=Heliobacterium mobile TaxID=28064 RepID=A0A6I3SMR2_HELMO|nr:hypothetical protein [Heliobacterium mobile]MTV50056.1 hypothetical protein [Heliobacterium mobile]